LIVGAVAVFALAMIGIGLTSVFVVAVGLLLLAMGAMGAVSPIRQSFIHQIIPTEQRASVLSVDNMVASAGGIVTQSLLGQVALAQGIGLGYVLGGFFTLLCIPLGWVLRRISGDTDRIGEPTPPAPRKTDAPDR
ncbi:MAG: MFS transporter, partial [Anaerolineae bacterium]|nr:MFS transporter [Anaerolineae bacterium]